MEDAPRTVRLSQVARAGVIALPTAAIVASTLLLRDRLPAEIAVQWGFDGDPNYGIPVIGEVLLLSAVWSLIGATSFFRGQEGSEGIPGRALAGAGFAVGVILTVHAEILYLNLDALSWEGTSKMTWPLVVAPIVTGSVLAGLAWAFVRWRPRRD